MKTQHNFRVFEIPSAEINVLAYNVYVCVWICVCLVCIRCILLWLCVRCFDLRDFKRWFNSHKNHIFLSIHRFIILFHGLKNVWLFINRIPEIFCTLHVFQQERLSVPTLRNNSWHLLIRFLAFINFIICGCSSLNRLKFLPASIYLVL